MSIFENANFNFPIYIIHLNDGNLENFPAQFNSRVIPYVIIKAHKAIANQEFPNHLDYCA
jgi:hypothetical protein